MVSMIKIRDGVNLSLDVPAFLLYPPMYFKLASTHDFFLICKTIKCHEIASSLEQGVLGNPNL